MLKNRPLTSPSSPPSLAGSTKNKQSILPRDDKGAGAKESKEGVERGVESLGVFQNDHDRGVWHELKYMHKACFKY
jgi:hypothetical protein